MRNVAQKCQWRAPEHFYRDTSSSSIDQTYLRQEDNPLTDGDPGFVDAEHKNLRLRTDSKVYDEVPGSEAIGFTKIELYEDDLSRELAE